MTGKESIPVESAAAHATIARPQDAAPVQVVREEPEFTTRAPPEHTHDIDARPRITPPPLAAPFYLKFAPQAWRDKWISSVLESKNVRARRFYEMTMQEMESSRIESMAMAMVEQARMIASFSAARISRSAEEAKSNAWDRISACSHTSSIHSVQTQATPTGPPNASFTGPGPGGYHNSLEGWHHQTPVPVIIWRDWFWILACSDEQNCPTHIEYLVNQFGAFCLHRGWARLVKPEHLQPADDPHKAFEAHRRAAKDSKQDAVERVRGTSQYFATLPRDRMRGQEANLPGWEGYTLHTNDSATAPDDRDYIRYYLPSGQLNLFAAVYLRFYEHDPPAKRIKQAAASHAWIERVCADDENPEWVRPYTRAHRELVAHASAVLQDPDAYAAYLSGRDVLEDLRAYSMAWARLGRFASEEILDMQLRAACPGFPPDEPFALRETWGLGLLYGLAALAAVAGIVSQRRQIWDIVDANRAWTAAFSGVAFAYVVVFFVYF